MFHSIITILTTAAVALHALLGCCAHHDHSCDASTSNPNVLTVVHADDHCSHRHHHHDEGSESTGEGAASGCGHEHDGGEPHGCDESDCTFTSTQRVSDVELMLAFSMWRLALGDVAHVDPVDGLLSPHSSAHAPLNPSCLSGSGRATTQVWRL